MGSMKEAEVSAFASFRVYLTSLWASVATKMISSGESWQNMPERTSLSSSLPVAKIVFVIAFDSTPEGMVMEVGASSGGVRGYSSLRWPLSLYFPSPADISTSSVPRSIEKETGIDFFPGLEAKEF